MKNFSRKFFNRAVPRTQRKGREENKKVQEKTSNKCKIVFQIPQYILKAKQILLSLHKCLRHSVTPLIVKIIQYMTSYGVMKSSLIKVVAKKNKNNMMMKTQ